MVGRFFYRRLCRGKTTFGMRLPPPPQTAGHTVLCIIPFFRCGCLHSRRLTIQMSCFPRTGFLIESICLTAFCHTSDRRRVSYPVVEFLLYIIVDTDSWLLMFYLAISRGGIPPRLVLSGGCAASLMYFVWLLSCEVVPREEELFFCKTYGLVNVSLHPISWLSCVLRRKDLLRRS